MIFFCTGVQLHKNIKFLCIPIYYYKFRDVHCKNVNWFVFQTIYYLYLFHLICQRKKNTWIAFQPTKYKCLLLGEQNQSLDFSDKLHLRQLQQEPGHLCEDLVA